jgi:hypothetical protein
LTKKDKQVKQCSLQNIAKQLSAPTSRSQQKYTQALPKGDRLINTTEIAAKTLAVSKVPHLIGGACPPAAVREGSDGFMNMVNFLNLFSCRMRVKKNKWICPCLAMSQRTVYGG